jgi:hypothetical protein
MDWDAILLDAELAFMRVVYRVWLLDYVKHHPEVKDHATNTNTNTNTNTESHSYTD